jgi:hypothetical protein
MLTVMTVMTVLTVIDCDDHDDRDNRDDRDDREDLRHSSSPCPFEMPARCISRCVSSEQQHGQSKDKSTHALHPHPYSGHFGIHKEDASMHIIFIHTNVLGLILSTHQTCAHHRQARIQLQYRIQCACMR